MDPPNDTKGFVCVRGSLDLLNYECAVFGAKADAVAESDVYFGLTGLIGDVIKVAIRIRFVQIDGRRDNSGFHGTQRGR